MSTNLNRREWVAAVAGSGAAAAAQTGAPPQTPEQELAAATQRQRRDLETLEKFNLPMAVEPAFRFEA
jgi:hypothetical protein